MKHRIRALVLALGTLLLLTGGRASAQSERVVLAGGCFWGMQAVFESLKGADSVVAGYAGGSPLTAHYEIVSTGTTGHAESVEITYDPTVLSFDEILRVYFLAAHDPTELNRQGPDEGSQYRSEIFYTTDAQRLESQRFIADLTRRHVFSNPIVTTIAPLRGFYPAEAYHQDFLVHNPENPYIVENDIPKLRALAAQFPKLIRTDAPPIRIAVFTKNSRARP
jgi:peptide-methionine (S)-S-oxide reductase